MNVNDGDGDDDSNNCSSNSISSPHGTDDGLNTDEHKLQGENETDSNDKDGDEDNSNSFSSHSIPSNRDTEIVLITHEQVEGTKDSTHDADSHDDNSKDDNNDIKNVNKKNQQVLPDEQEKEAKDSTDNQDANKIKVVVNQHDATCDALGNSLASSSAKEGEKSMGGNIGKSSKDRQRSSKSKKDKKLRDRESMEMGWKQERYDKLLYMAKKDMTKHIKQTKTFICQKLIRKLKQQQQQQQQKSSPEDAKASSNSSSISKQNKSSKVEDEMKSYKSLNNDIVVQEAVRRLGLIALNPSWVPNANDEASNDTDQDTIQANKLMVETILKHKKMEACLEQWNEKVTEHRRWCLRRAEIAASKRQSGGPSVVFTDDLYRNSKTTKRKNKQQQQNQATKKRPRNDGDHQSSTLNLTESSIFCSLGGEDGSDNNGEENDEDYGMDPASRSAYGPGGDEFYQEDGGKKKNRKGQRARRAKALAMQAKKEGRKYESTNWRKRKTVDDDGGNKESAQSQHSRDHRLNNRDHSQWKQGTSHKQNLRHQHSSDQQSDRRQQKPKQQETKDAAQHHPSWAAKQAQSTGIVAFQGKKITFD